MFLFGRRFPGTVISSITVVLYTFSFCFCHFNSDRSVLIEFKNSVIDKNSILSSWNHSYDHCSWQGVFCDANSAVRAVIITGNFNSNGSHSTSAISKCNFSQFQLYGSGRGLKASSTYLNGSILGRLPPVMGTLTELRVLSLPFNEFRGEIPKEIWRLTKLEVLDLEGNKLTGRIPNEISRLRKLRVLNLGFNQFVGEIPFMISKCVSLQVLNLAGNLMNGSIPETIVELGSLVLLDLSRNKFHAHVANDFKFSKNLAHLCNGEVGDAVNQCLTRKLLSYEDWINSSSLVNSSPVSSSNLGSGYAEEMTIAESPSVIASARGKHSISSIAIAGVISASAIVSVLLALTILFFYTRKRMPKSSFQVAGFREIKLFSDPGVPLTFDIVVQATANFSTSYCIGHGGFGSTYKVEISEGVFLAVKRLSVGKYLQGVKQFHAEIKTLGRIRHPNLVTLVGYHASQMDMFLVYNHLPGGNLEKFIKERSERGGIDWTILHKIALGIASAIAFLHDECVPRILHRDIKPSNILLDNEFNAYLSDFGLSRLLGNSETHATTGVAGTFGYVAPEYALTCRVSEKSDVYSYGVVLLELISDKKVLDPSFSSHINGFNIVSWACKLVREGRAEDAFAAGLWEMGPRDKLVAALNLGVFCTVEALSVRPTMKHVVHRLKQIQS